MRTKTCARCGETKDASAFFPRGDGPGLRSPCRACARRTADQKARRRALRASSPERAIIAGAIQRCHNPKNPNFDNYGGRGIVVCHRWQESAEHFIADMGPRPTPKHTLERIDNSGGYNPGNCRWATRAEQNANTRQNHRLTIDGESLILAEWARRAGVSGNLIRDRLRLGWDSKRAVFEPVGQTRNTRPRRAA